MFISQQVHFSNFYTNTDFANRLKVEENAFSFDIFCQSKIWDFKNPFTHYLVLQLHCSNNDVRTCCYITVDSGTPASQNGVSFYDVFLNRAGG
jgi:hypothetical protein